MDKFHQIVKKQIDMLNIPQTEVIEYEVCFPSFNDNKILSIIVTKSKLILIPCKSDWKQHEIRIFELSHLQSTQFEVGDLYKTTLRVIKIKKFVKIRLKFEDHEKAIRLFITSDTSHELVKIYERIQNYFSEAKFEMNGEMEEDKDGLILLWDYDNIKLRKNGRINTYLVDRIRKEILQYGPLKGGLYCYNQQISDDEIRAIEEIDPLIKPRQVTKGKDQADLKLMHEGSILIEEKSPARAMIISKDHIFADYSNEIYDSGVELILMQTGGTSQKWFDNASKFLTINLFSVNCKEKTCKDKFSLKEEMEEHYKQTHIVVEKKFGCDECNKNFTTEKGRDAHKGKKHPTTFLCNGCKKPFTKEQGLIQHKRDKGH